MTAQTIHLAAYRPERPSADDDVNQRRHRALCSLVRVRASMANATPANGARRRLDVMFVVPPGRVRLPDARDAWAVLAAALAETGHVEADGPLWLARGTIDFRTGERHELGTFLTLSEIPDDETPDALSARTVPAGARP